MSLGTDFSRNQVNNGLVVVINRFRQANPADRRGMSARITEISLHIGEGGGNGWWCLYAYYNHLRHQTVFFCFDSESPALILSVTHGEGER